MKIYKFNVNKDYEKARYFLLELGLSSNLIKSITKEMGQIRKNGTSIRVNERISKNDTIEIRFKEQEQNLIVPILYNLDIAYEDDYFIVINKPNGIATIPSYCNYTNSLANYVTYYMQNKEKDFVFRTVNRLDKETSGLVLICKDLVVYNLLKLNKIIKKYEVITTGKLKKQIINKCIATIKMNDDRNDIKRIISKNGKPATTQILRTKYSRKHNISYSTIKLFTGRTHQIRVHLSSINNSILGDNLYGTKKADRMYLNCYHLKFYHPILKKNITIIRKIFPKQFKLLRNQIQHIL